MQKCYLVYKLCNGRLTAEIQYGEHTTGESKIKVTNEVKRVELLDHNNYPIETWIKLYPYEVQK